MVTDVYVALGVVALTTAVLTWLVTSWCGCTGGHVWTEWSPMDRYRVSPYSHKPEVVIERFHKRRCQCAGCTADEEKYEYEVLNVHRNDLQEAIEGLEGDDSAE